MRMDRDVLGLAFFFFKQKTAYEMRISDWSSDVCSSDLLPLDPQCRQARGFPLQEIPRRLGRKGQHQSVLVLPVPEHLHACIVSIGVSCDRLSQRHAIDAGRWRGTRNLADLRRG